MKIVPYFFSDESLVELMERNLSSSWKLIEILKEFSVLFKELIMESEKESNFLIEIKRLFDSIFTVLQKNEELEKLKVDKEILINHQREVKEEFMKNFLFGNYLVETIYMKKGLK